MSPRLSWQSVKRGEIDSSNAVVAPGGREQSGTGGKERRQERILKHQYRETIRRNESFLVIDEGRETEENKNKRRERINEREKNRV